jgi:hypothetical protein
MHTVSVSVCVCARVRACHRLFNDIDQLQRYVALSNKDFTIMSKEALEQSQIE